MVDIAKNHQESLHTQGMGDGPAVFITRVHLKNFRCFTKYQIDFTAPFILLEGVNGAGKTSFLEALYYTCYLRSFRTHSPKELIKFGTDGFFIEVEVTNNLYTHEFMHDIQIGFSHNRKLVKIDKKPIASYKELMHAYRVISLTEDDVGLIKGGPQTRRIFMDQALLLTNPEYLTLLRTYRQIVEQRNALLNQHKLNPDSYTILTEKLWEYTRLIQETRIASITQFGSQVSELARDYFDIDLSISFAYRPKYEPGNSLQEFTENNPLLYDRELRYKRTLFGAHLDDFLIQFQKQHAKMYASRGQQKLIVLLIKMAQAKQLQQSGLGGILLLDDFMTDFDKIRAGQLITALENLKSQLIFTCPLQGEMFTNELERRNAQVVKLTH